MSQIFKITDSSSQSDVDEAVSAVIEAVSQGGLAVIPTDTCYAVIADAFNPEAVALLRRAKNQSPDIPVPVGVASLATADGIATFSELARDLVTALWPGPLTLLTKAQPSVMLAVANSDDALALRIPNHELARKVLGGIGPTAMTGAQLSGTSRITSCEAAKGALGDLVTIYIDGGELDGGQSAVVDATGEYLRLVRNGMVSLTDLRAIVPMVIDATATNASDTSF